VAPLGWDNQISPFCLKLARGMFARPAKGYARHRRLRNQISNSSKCKFL